MADLQEAGYLKEIEPLKHEVGTCYRCHTVIEPMVSKQWFVKMEPLAKPAIESVEKGEIKFVPDRFTKNYLNWMRGSRGGATRSRHGTALTAVQPPLPSLPPQPARTAAAPT